MIKKYKQSLSNQLKDKDFSEIIKGGSIHLIAKAISVLLGILFSLIITRYYGASEMGVYSIVNSYFIIALIFSMMGTHTAILRFIPEHIVKYSYSSAFQLFVQVFKMVLFFSTIVAVVSYFFAPYIAERIFNKEYLYPLFTLASFFIIFQAVGKLSIETTRALKEIKIYALYDVSNTLFKIVVLSVLTYLFYAEYNPIYTLFTSYIFLFIGSLVFVIYFFKYKKNSQHDIQKFTNKKIVNIAFPMFLTGVMSAVISQTDVIMLGMMKSVEEVGIYAIVAKLAMLTSFVLTSINSIATPKFSELYHSGKIDILTSVAQRSSKLIFWVSLPIILIFILFGKYILAVFGEEFILGYSVLLLLVFGQFVNGMAGSVGSFLNMTGQQKVFNRIVIIGGVTNIVLNYILIPLYGIEGAAFASMLSIILWNVLASLYIKYKFGFYIGYMPIKIKRQG